MREISRRRFLEMGAFGSLLGAFGCRGGVPTIFGYQIGNEALYDLNVGTVYVPVFYNRTLQTTPYRGFEVDITQAVVQEIGAKTPYRVVSDPARADTELIGSIVLMQKNLFNRTQQNTVREGELAVGVDVVWRDLRDGTILSAPRKRRKPGSTDPNPNEPPPVPFDPTIEPPPVVSVVPPPTPIRIVASGRYVQELGETNASAMKRVQYQVAIQIVSMMEKRW